MRLSISILSALLMLSANIARAQSAASTPDAPPATDAPSPFAADGAPAAAEAPPPTASAAEPVELNGVNVEGKRDPLSESDRKLRELINRLPCTGCDTKTKKIDEKRSYVEKVTRYVTHEVLPGPVYDDSNARANDPDPVRNAETEERGHPSGLGAPSDHP